MGEEARSGEQSFGDNSWSLISERFPKSPRFYRHFALVNGPILASTITVKRIVTTLTSCGTLGNFL